MFCPEGVQLEAAYRELRDGVALHAFARLPDGAAHLLDHLVVDLAKGVKALNGLVRPERGSRALREEERAPEHRDCAVAGLELDRFFGWWALDVFIPSFHPPSTSSSSSSSTLLSRVSSSVAWPRSQRLWRVRWSSAH
jgi:hypothetical protein